jgi:predicted DNA-binding transcriptional regulator AlpA
MNKSKKDTFWMITLLMRINNRFLISQEGLIFSAMDKLLKLSLERLMQKVEWLEKQNEKLNERFKSLQQHYDAALSTSKQIGEDVLMDTKEVLELLGISYNTLQAIVRKQLIQPIRINQRRVRYSRKGILAYINSVKS